MSRDNLAITKTIYVTRTGLPLSFHFEWPFRHATSGADFEVLHATITLENSEGLRARVAVNLAATLREVMPSLQAKDTEAPVINALRMDIDHQQIEFAKSAKLVPLPLSSRHYNFRQGRWVFGHASDDDIAKMIERKVYWHSRLVGGEVWLGDEIEAMYLDTTTDHVAEIAAGLANDGRFAMARRYATALPALIDQQGKFETEMAEALKQLEQKHTFERG
jgi:hypothetical protein